MKKRLAKMPTTSSIFDQAAESGESGGRLINFSDRAKDSTYIGSGSGVSYSDSTTLATKLQFDEEEIKKSYSPTVNRSSGIKKRSPLSRKIIRTHYAKELIVNLDWLSEYHEADTPLCIPYISSILNLITKFADENFDDPFSSFLLALYDGLRNEDSYLVIEKEVYKRICSYVKVLNNKELDYKLVDKYIFKLEKSGLNITPY